MLTYSHFSIFETILPGMSGKPCPSEKPDGTANFFGPESTTVQGARPRLDDPEPQTAITPAEPTGSSQLGTDDGTAVGKPRAATSAESGGSPSGDDPVASRICR